MSAAANELLQAVLREILRALGELAHHGAAQASAVQASPAAQAYEESIDLHSLPLSETDRAALAQRLGRGEVQATLDVAGATRIFETAYSGAWWVQHADAQGHTVLEQVVVARVPPLLLAHQADINAATRRLEAELAAETGLSVPGRPKGERWSAQHDSTPESLELEERSND